MQPHKIGCFFTCQLKNCYNCYVGTNPIVVRGIKFRGETKMTQKRNYRDAGTGQYVTKKYAESHPKTTVSEPRPNNKPSKKK